MLMSAPNSSQPPLHYQHWPRNVPHEIPAAESTLWDNLEVTARRYPNKTALDFLGYQISFSQLKQQAESLAGWLQQQAGVEHGDRVILMMQNCPQFIIAYYAILRAGAVVVPVNPMTRAAELPHYVTDPGAKVAICTADVAGEILKAQSQLQKTEQLQNLVVTRYRDCMSDTGDPLLGPPQQWTSWLNADPELPLWATAWVDALQQGNQPAAYRGAADDLVALGYTSGTTGKPKGCMHTNRTIGHNVFAGAVWNNGCAADKCFSVVPMFHITGMLYGMHTPIYLGATSVILPRWDRELAGRLISLHGITTWTNIPTMIIDLLGSPNVAEFDLSSLRHIGGGGAAMPEAVAKRLQEQYGLRYQEGYGLTETAAPSHGNPPQRPKRQCLGMPIIGTEARVIDPETLKEVQQGETGEIVIHGPQVFKGYWNNPRATEQAFIELDGKSFFRSGDLGRIDEDGYYFITDRLKRMINASGFKVWPAEVESMLFQHPGIQEACVISTRDPYRGETVKALVVPRAESAATLSAEEIETWRTTKWRLTKFPEWCSSLTNYPSQAAAK